MSRIIKMVGPAGLPLVAALLHQFYVSYRLNAESYIFKWQASPQYHDAFLKQGAIQLALPVTERKVRVLTGAQVDARQRALIRDPANSCRSKRPVGSDQPSWARALYLDHAANYSYNKPWVDQTYAIVKDAAVSFE